MKLTLITAAVLGLALSAGAYADPGKMQERHLDRMTERLDLTDEQRTQVAALMERHHARTAEARAELKQAHEQMREEMQAILTDEQAEKMKSMHGRMGKGKHRGKDKRGDHGDHGDHERH